MDAANLVTVELDGQPLDVPGSPLWAPNVTLENRAELEAVSLDVTEHTARFPVRARGGHLPHAGRGRAR